MRGRWVTVVVGLLVVAAVAWSLLEEERFVVEGPRLERVATGTRVVGTVLNRGESAALVRIEVSLITENGRPPEKEVVELHDLGAGGRASFATAAHRGDVKTYSIRVDQGRNPYGN